mgnify:CR=1 FL=1
MVFSGANNVGSDFRGNFTQIKDTSRDLDDKFFGDGWRGIAGRNFKLGEVYRVYRLGQARKSGAPCLVFENGFRACPSRFRPAVIDNSYKETEIVTLIKGKVKA